MTSLLVLAPNWLGDAVMALPAIADVRRRHPGARIVAAARRSVAELFAMVPHVNDTIALDWNGKLWGRGAIEQDAARLAASGAEVAIVLPNSFASAWLVRRAGIPGWGYAADFRSRLLSRAVPRPRGSRHQGAYYQHLTQALGFASGPLEPVLQVPEPALEAARAQLRGEGWNGSAPLVVCAPGAAYGTAKRWLPEYVARLATSLVRQHGVVCALAGGRGDRETTAAVKQAVGADVSASVIDLAGKTTLERLAGLCALAGVCVSNDSGTMHVAAAIGTPVVAIFGPTREHETAPLTRAGGQARVLTHPVWCRPCMLRECPLTHQCMKGISPERVQRTVEELIA